MVTPAGYRVIFLPLPSGSCPTLNFGRDRKALCHEAKGNSEVKRLVGLVSKIFFDSLVILFIDGVLVGLVGLGRNLFLPTWL